MVMMFAIIIFFLFVVISNQYERVAGVPLSYYGRVCAGSGYVAARNNWYAAHPTECDKFIQCHIDKYMDLVGEERLCAFSTYWDNNLMSCVGVSEANCQTDNCKSQPNNTMYKANGNCRGYWKCMAGHSKAKCCEIGELFDSAHGCVDDENKECTQFCLDDVVPEPIACDKRSTLDANVFEQLSSSGWMRMNCAPGTSYVQEMCDCAMFSDTRPIAEPDICKPEIYLPFDTDTNDRSGNDYSVLNTNVFVRNGSAVFDGNSKLVIPRFNNLDHISSIYINVKYVTNHMMGGERAIVSNDDGNGYSILIKEDNNTIQFGCKTTESPAGIEVYFKQGLYNTQPSYKDVGFQVDSGKLICRNGRVARSVNARGPLQTIKSGLQIGYSAGVKSFTGEIEEITVYLCNPRTMA